MLEFVLAIFLFVIGILVFVSDSITMPSRFGANQNHLIPPATYLVSALPIGFSLLILVRRIFPALANKVGPAILILSIVLFLIGYVIQA